MAGQKIGPHPLQLESTWVSAARNAKTLWPFLLGFGITGTLLFQVAISQTADDIKNSPFSNPKEKHY
ncbi:hypothetical protein WJX84_000852 [Apatococcus fuscideae]|uniref:Uncharacterized protein n=1 Tax=Apatococcus fuscideae TaxID=2026836 RepID=A0AAW1SSM0_9CHLO